MFKIFKKKKDLNWFNEFATKLPNYYSMVIEQIKQGIIIDLIKMENTLYYHFKLNNSIAANFYNPNAIAYEIRNCSFIDSETNEIINFTIHVQFNILAFFETKAETCLIAKSNSINLNNIQFYKEDLKINYLELSNHLPEYLLGLINVPFIELINLNNYEYYKIAEKEESYLLSDRIGNLFSLNITLNELLPTKEKEIILSYF